MHTKSAKAVFCFKIKEGKYDTAQLPLPLICMAWTAIKA